MMLRSTLQDWFLEKETAEEEQKNIISYEDVKGAFLSFRRNQATHLPEFLGQHAPSPPRGAAR